MYSSNYRGERVSDKAGGGGQTRMGKLNCDGKIIA